MGRPDPKIKGSQPWVAAAAMGHRSNNYSESKRNDHLDNCVKRTGHVGQKDDTSNVVGANLWGSVGIVTREYKEADERCVWIDLVGLPLASWAPEVYKKLGGRWGSSVFTDMVSDGPMSHGKGFVSS
ncbi:hypothetical protein Tco_1240178 [Tanacetum coccineum]